MDFYTRVPIQFGISRSYAAGTPFGLADMSEAAPAVVLAVHQRDYHACRCCGFRALKYQQVLALDDNPRNLDHMVTVCIFCQQCFRVDAAARMRSAVLVWLPEIDQVTVHYAARDLYRARLATGRIAEMARQVLDQLLPTNTSRREALRARGGTDDPTVYAQTAREKAGGPRSHSEVDLSEGLRLFPLDRRINRQLDVEFNEFPKILAYWRSSDGPFAGSSGYQYLEVLAAALQGSGSTSARS